MDSMIIYDSFIQAFVLWAGAAFLGCLAGLIWVLIKDGRKKKRNDQKE